MVDGCRRRYGAVLMRVMAGRAFVDVLCIAARLRPDVGTCCVLSRRDMCVLCPLDVGTCWVL
eukprot:2898917-Rhodomonas_salina.3